MKGTRNLPCVETTDVPRREEVMWLPSDALTASAASERYDLAKFALSSRIRPSSASRWETLSMLLPREILRRPPPSRVDFACFWSNRIGYTLPKLYIKQQYCVSCAVHSRVVRARKVAERRIRTFARPQFKGVGCRWSDCLYLGAQLRLSSLVLRHNMIL